MLFKNCPLYQILFVLAMPAENFWNPHLFKMSVSAPVKYVNVCKNHLKFIRMANAHFYMGVWNLDKRVLIADFGKGMIIMDNCFNYPTIFAGNSQVELPPTWDDMSKTNDSAPKVVRLDKTKQEFKDIEDMFKKSVLAGKYSSQFNAATLVVDAVSIMYYHRSQSDVWKGSGCREVRLAILK